MPRPPFEINADFILSTNNIPEYLKVTDEVNVAVVKEMARVGIAHMKATVTVRTGTLKRSIKADKPSQHRDRTLEAKTRDLGHPVPDPEVVGDVASLVVGGTTNYALIQETRKPYIQPGFGRIAAEARFIIAREGKRYNGIR